MEALEQLLIQVQVVVVDVLVEKAAVADVGPCAQKQLEYPNEISRFCQLENMEMSLEEYVYFAFNNQLINNKLYEET